MTATYHTPGKKSRAVSCAQAGSLPETNFIPRFPAPYLWRWNLGCSTSTDKQPSTVGSRLLSLLRPLHILSQGPERAITWRYVAGARADYRQTLDFRASGCPEDQGLMITHKRLSEGVPVFPASFGRSSLPETLGATFCCLLQGPNGCTRGLLHQFFRHRCIAGAFASIFYHRRLCVTPWEPVAARSCLAWPRTGAASDASRPPAEGIAGVLDQTSAGLYVPYAVSWSRTSRRSSSAAPVLPANCRILSSNRSRALCRVEEEIELKSAKSSIRSGSRRCSGDL